LVGDEEPTITEKPQSKIPHTRVERRDRARPKIEDKNSLLDINGKEDL
jgi:hypothetical protein